MLTTITLTNFRNYESARINFDAQTTVIYGSNGSGKTNLLEAISLLTPGRGIRSCKLEDIKKHGQDEWSVFSEVDGYKVASGLEAGRQRRTIKIDGEKQSGGNALAEYVSCVWLTPQIDGIFLEGSGDRRRFFDRLIYNFDPEHASRVAIYENAMRERLKLLKDGHNDPIWLKSLEQRMAEYGVAIAAARIEVIGYLQNAIDKSETDFPTPEIRIESDYEASLIESSALDVEEKLLADLAESRMHDMRSGRSNIGVHRSDFQVNFKEKNVPAHLCSTGEQKGLLISIILGLARLLRERRNKTPIILLDEVVAHLDETRRQQLFAELHNLGCQSFLTGTEKALFAGLLGQVQFFEVHNSEIKIA